MLWNCNQDMDLLYILSRATFYRGDLFQQSHFYDCQPIWLHFSWRLLYVCPAWSYLLPLWGFWALQFNKKPLWEYVVSRLLTRIINWSIEVFAVIKLSSEYYPAGENLLTCVDSSLRLGHNMTLALLPHSFTAKWQVLIAPMQLFFLQFYFNILQIWMNNFFF